MNGDAVSLMGRTICFYWLQIFNRKRETVSGGKNNVHTEPDLLKYIDSVKRIWYLSPMRAAKVQASLRTRAVSPEPSLFAHTSNKSRGTFRQKARSLAPLNGLACAVKICHDGMLEDTNSLDGARIICRSNRFWNKGIWAHRRILQLTQNNYCLEQHGE